MADVTTLIEQNHRALARLFDEYERAIAPSDQASLDRMGELFEKMKPLLPTHPHPSVPGNATAQLLAGPPPASPTAYATSSAAGPRAESRARERQQRS
jgi:hypothetical protein